MKKFNSLMAIVMIMLIITMPIAFAQSTLQQGVVVPVSNPTIQQGVVTSVSNPTLQQGIVTSVSNLTTDVTTATTNLLTNISQLQFVDVPNATAIDQQQTGESIVVNVVGYEPPTLKSSLIEDDDVPVYALLKGSTLGTLLGSSSTAGPLYGLPNIKLINVRPLNVETVNALKGTPRYVRPNTYSLDNLGLLAMLVKKIEVEANMPDEIVLSMVADIYFEDAATTYSLFTQDIFLNEEPVEAEWRQTSLDSSAFFAKRGFLRASKVEGNKVSLVYYSGSDLLPPYTGSPRPIQSFDLTVGQTSQFFTIRESQGLAQNTFRVKLLEVVDPSQKRVKVQLNVDGTTTETLLKEGSTIYPGSTWKVQTISYIQNVKENKMDVSVKLVSSNSVQEAKKTYYTQKNVANVKSTADPCVGKVQVLDSLMNTQLTTSSSSNEIKNIVIPGLQSAVRLEDGKVFNHQDVTQALPQGHYVFWKNTDGASLNVEYFAHISGMLSETPDSSYNLMPEIRYLFEIADKNYYVTNKGYDGEKLTANIAVEIENKVSDLSALDSTAKQAQIFVNNVKETNQENILCTAVAEYKKIASGCSGTADDDGVALGAKAAFKIAEAYDWMGYPQQALEYYQKSLEDKRGDHIVKAEAKINQLQKSVEEGASYFVARFTDQGRSIELKVLDLIGIKESEKSSFTVDVAGEGTKTLTLGTELFRDPIIKKQNNKDYVTQWVVNKVGPNYVVAQQVVTIVESKTQVGSEVPLTTVKLYGLQTVYNYVVAQGKKVTGFVSATTTSAYSAVTSWLNPTALPVSTATSKTIALKSTVLLDGKAVTLQDIKSKNSVIVSIIPGTGQPLKSVSNFTLHIPIEKRAIQLTPEKIMEKINKTEATIRGLNKVIEDLDSVLKTWKQVCLFTFLYLTIKNSFLSGTSRNIARSYVMRGKDGNSGWNKYCQANSGANRLYSNFDECIRKNTDKIQTNLDESQNIIEQVDSDMENYKNQQWYKDLMAKYNNNEKYAQYLGKDLYNAQTIRDYRYWSLMQNTKSYEENTGQKVEKGLSYDFKKEVDNSLKNFEFNKSVTSFNNAVKIIEDKYKDFDSKSDAEKQQIFQDVVTYSATKKQDIVSNNFIYMRNMNINTLTTVRQKGTKIVSYSPNGEIALEKATVTDYIDKLDYLRESSNVEADKTLLLKNRGDIEKIYGKALATQLSSNQGSIYKEAGCKVSKTKDCNLYVFQGSTQVQAQVRKTYDPTAPLEYYPDGKPYCVPTTNGNFIKILDFFNDGSPKTIQEWNVGTDGRLCTGDDILLKHNSVLMQASQNAYYRQLLTAVNKFTKKKKGEVVTVGGKKWVVSDNAAGLKTQAKNPTCYDVMDSDDCQTLFGVCDPVLCPPSRFNLGGNWKVDNVVQTGLIGSLVLGLHNFNLPSEPLPICLTGISAGLKTIRSVLEGYVQCLKVAYVQGKTVGICDKVRSVYTCEIIWREALALFKVKGGLLKWITNKFSGSEKPNGGEYLTFDSALKNTENSANFFFKQYGTTAFAAFNSRSTSEIGTEICKRAIYGKLPNFGDLLDQLSTPEDPPQYTAIMSVSPYSETTGQDAYQVYYHIYAGKTAKAPVTSTQGVFNQGGIVNSGTTAQKGVDYSVFLKNDLGQTFYLTQTCKGTRAFIALGGLADFTVDCVAPKGFNQVCITLNGDTKCGFGKISTSFGVNYVNDLVVADEAKRNIKTEAECAPSNPSSSPSLLAAAGATQAGMITPGILGALSTVSDFANTGIRRVCSVANPGAGTNPNNFKVVGICGQDSFGNNLGSCWIDMASVSIKDASMMAEVKKQFDEQTLKKIKELAGVKNTLDEAQSKAKLLQVVALPQNTCIEKFTGMIGYRDVATTSLDGTSSCKGQYRFGEMLDKLARDINCAKYDPQREFAKLIVSFENELNLIRAQHDRDVVELSKRYTASALPAKVNELVLATVQKMEAAKVTYKTQLQSLETKEKKSVPDKHTELDTILNNYKSKVGGAQVTTALKTVLTPADLANQTNLCNQCGEGITCDDTRCHAMNFCYADKTNDLFTKCLPCAKSTSCVDFNKNKALCENTAECKNLRGFECSYLDVLNVCLPKSTSATTINQAKLKECSDKCSADIFLSLIGQASCSLEKCTGNGCYFIKSALGSPSCSACQTATSCSAFDNDLAACNSCIGGSLSCRYENGKCIPGIGTLVPIAAPTNLPTSNPTTNTCNDYYTKFPPAQTLVSYGHYIQNNPMSAVAGDIITYPVSGDMRFSLTTSQWDAYAKSNKPTFTPTENPTFENFWVTTYYTMTCEGLGLTLDEMMTKHGPTGEAWQCAGKCYLGKDEKDCTKYPHSSTSTGMDTQPLKTIAVNRVVGSVGHIPYGAYVYLTSAAYPIINGWYLAGDTGAPKGQKWLDIYVGVGETTYAPYRLSTKDVKVWVYPMIKGNAQCQSNQITGATTGDLYCPSIEKVYKTRDWDNFNSIYGKIVGQGTSADNSAVRLNSGPFSFMGQTITMNKKMEPIMKCVEQEIKKCSENYPLKTTSTLRNRNSVSTISRHMYGITIDWNNNENPYCTQNYWSKCGTAEGAKYALCCATNPQNRFKLPKCYVDAFKKYGFVWGGDWGPNGYYDGKTSGYYGMADYMHFEFRGNPNSLPSNFAQSSGTPVTTTSPVTTTTSPDLSAIGVTGKYTGLSIQNVYQANGQSYDLADCVRNQLGFTNDCFVDFSFKDSTLMTDGSKSSRMWIPGVNDVLIQKLPLIVMLHGNNGGGEKYTYLSNNNENQKLYVAVGDLVKNNFISPMIVAAPSQVKNQKDYSGTLSTSLWVNFNLDDFVDAVKLNLPKDVSIDENNIILIGHSGAGCNNNNGVRSALKTSNKYSPKHIVLSEICYGETADNIYKNYLSSNSVSKLYSVSRSTSGQHYDHSSFTSRLNVVNEVNPSLDIPCISDFTTCKKNSDGNIFSYTTNQGIWDIFGSLDSVSASHSAITYMFLQKLLLVNYRTYSVPLVTSTTVTKISCDSNLKIAAVGDSLTAYTTNWQWPNQLKNLCPSLTVDKVGASGYNTKRILDSFNTANVPDNYDVAIIMGGTNDLTQDQSFEYITNNLQQMYKAADAKGKYVVAMTIPPWKGSSLWSEKRQEMTDIINVWIQSNSYIYGVDKVVDVYDLLEEGETDHFKSAYGYCSSCENMHFIAAGHKAIAEKLKTDVFVDSSSVYVTEFTEAELEFYELDIDLFEGDFENSFDEFEIPKIELG